MQQQNIYNPDRRQYIELFLAARDLPNIELFSKSDPICQVFYTLQGENEVLFGETEVIHDNLDPSWAKSFTFEYYPTINQQLRLVVSDYDSKKKKTALGEYKATLQQIITSPKQLLIGPLQAQKFPKGDMYLKGVLLEESNQFVSLQFSGKNIINTDGIFGKTDPFLKFYLHSEGIWCQVYVTEYIAECLNPTWFEFEISLQRLCQNDENRKFKVECYDWHDKGRNNRLIGGFETTIDEIFNKNKETFNINMPKGGSGGAIQIISKKRIFRANFNDFVNQGTIFNLVMGIDYSLHNGNPRFPDSLHAINDDLVNHYSKCIKISASALEMYDIKKQIALYGIGAEPHFQNYYQNSYQTIFPLSGDFQKPQFCEASEVLKQYTNTLPLIQFNGHFKLNDFLNYLQTITKANQGKLKYTVCFILTQGEIADTEDVLNTLIEGTKLPYSVVFIGMGKDKNFKFLQELDQLVMEKSTTKRSSISFVEYDKYQSYPQLFQRYLVAKVPYQMIAYQNAQF